MLFTQDAEVFSDVNLQHATEAHIVLPALQKGAVISLKASLQKGADEADVNLQLPSYFKATRTPTW